jgi:hypothetical protein
MIEAIESPASLGRSRLHALLNADPGVSVARKSMQII